MLKGTDLDERSENTINNLQILYLTESGLEVKLIPLPKNLSAIEQIVCEMGCDPGVNWEIDTNSQQATILVDLYRAKTYEELSAQYLSFSDIGDINVGISSKEKIDEKMRELNFVEKYRVEI